VKDTALSLSLIKQLAEAELAAEGRAKGPEASAALAQKIEQR
jgi:hypothetical protein